jgi:hypothetical protein
MVGMKLLDMIVIASFENQNHSNRELDSGISLPTTKGHPVT